MSLVGLALGALHDGDKNGIFCAEAAQAPIFVLHACSISVLIHSKDENQSTRALLALPEPYLSAPFPPVLMFCSHGEPR